ncbi:hypothetical protein BH09VER1_BH09VER1_34410 [soil metagenome]
MNRLFLSALSLGLVGLTSCASWHYRKTEDQKTTFGRSGNTLSLAEGPVHVQFAVLPGWKIISALDEPLDWDYAADAPDNKIGFGVMLAAQKGSLTIAERQQAYLKNVHQLYDPKARMEKAGSVTLLGGRVIPSYRYTSPYWGERIVVIIPEGAYVTTFEFSNRDQKSLKEQEGEIQKVLGTYSAQIK